ncbi:helix-turn-helix domain-containing protein [Roseibium sp.]|uniref:helix-turn-helix domain-containing protein n=1 Tax=Roseibium sp. TaxID=1936156 RepID=UPI003BAB82DD
MLANWFPATEFTDKHDFIHNEEYFDCDEQAIRFGNRSGYVQLGAGPFSGRLFSADVGDVSIYVEYSNQPLEKEVLISPDHFSFVTAISRSEPDVAFGGVTKSTDWLQVAAPGGEHVALVPSECVLVLARIEKSRLLSHSALLPEVADWLHSLPKHPVFVNSPWLARRFRADVQVVLECVISGGGGICRAAADKAFVCALVNSFNMELLRQNTIATHKISRARERFLLARKLLLEAHEDVTEHFRLASRKLGSQRLVEQAFSNQVNMGPLSYSRVMRLHNARRKLLDKAFVEENIGDIAAEEGFWDWSRFTSYYRRQFNELPSETRMRAGFPVG